MGFIALFFFLHPKAVEEKQKKGKKTFQSFQFDFFVPFLVYSESRQPVPVYTKILCRAIITQHTSSFCMFTLLTRNEIEITAQSPYENTHTFPRAHA